MIQIKPKAFFALVAVTPIAAMAQTPDSERVSEIVELLPFSVESKESTHSNLVLRKEQIQMASSLTSALDHISTLPGVIVQEGDAYGGDDWSTTVSIRGFQTTRSSSQLGYTIDDLPNGNTNYGGGAKPNRFIDTENIGEVIVSQGTSDISSASTTALGGTIQYKMLAPSFEKSATVEASVGDNNARRFFLRANSGLVGQETRAFISVSDSFHNRWTDIGDNGISDRQHIDSRVITKWGNAQVDFRFSWDDIHEDNYNGVSQAAFAENPNWDRLNGTWTGSPAIDQNFVEGWSTVRENMLFGVKFTLPLGERGVLEAQPYYHDQSGEGHWIPPYQRRGFDENGSPVYIAQLAASEQRVFFVDADANDIFPTEGVTNPFDLSQYDIDAETAEGAVPASSFRTSHYGNSRYGVRLNYEHSTENNKILAGLWHEQQERDNGRDWHKIFDPLERMDYDNTPYWTDFQQTLDTETTTLYIQDTFTKNNFTAQVGIKQYFVDISGNDTILNVPTQSKNSDSDILPSFGAIFKVFENKGQFFANYTQNFAAMSDIVIQRDASPSLEAEQADSIDLGYRHTDGNLSWSANFYSIKFDNKISFVEPQGDDVTDINYDIGLAGGYVNVGGIESEGLELSANYRFNDAFSTNFSATFNDSTYVEDIPENGVFKGNEVVGAAGEIFVASLYYTAANGFYSNVSGKFTGERQGTLDNSEQLDAYFHVNLSMGYRMKMENSFAKSFKAEVKVHNLLDESYLATPDGDGAKTTGNYFIGAPRAVSATFGFEF